MQNSETTIEFSLNVYTEFSDDFLERNRSNLLPLVVRDQDATTAPARHGWHRASLNWSIFVVQWFTRFSEYAESAEFLVHLGKLNYVFFHVDLFPLCPRVGKILCLHSTQSNKIYPQVQASKAYVCQVWLCWIDLYYFFNLNIESKT